MLHSFIEQHQDATVVQTQTTYLELAGVTGKFRIHYRGKVEFSLRIGTHGVLAHFTEHPLLWDYNGPQDTVYLAGPAPDPPALVEALQRAVATASHQWRALNRYLFGSKPAGALALLEQNLADGSGLLLQRAPVPIVQAVLEVCRQHGTATYTFAPLRPEPIPAAAPYKVLFIGACYVIAHDFTVQEL